MVAALLIGPQERAALHELRTRAAATPVDMRTLMARLATADGKAAHMRQMTAQSIEIPVDFLLTFSIEIGHPGGGGVARHMSMSVDRAERVPHPAALWMVAEELGFVGALENCTVWPEKLQGHGTAINVVQLLAADQVGRA